MNTRTASATAVAVVALVTAWQRPQDAPEQPSPTLIAQPVADTTPPPPDSPRRDSAAANKAEKYPTGKFLVLRYLHSASNDTSLPTGATPGVVIVTVPDPIDSHLDWAFDTYLESVRRAYETAGYVLDRFWLPWSAKPDTTLVEGSGARGRRVREEYPGVLLFRGVSAKGPALQLVYLVGEVPTAGVHKGALRRALEDRDRLVANTPADSVRIVGPSFSGSTASLVQLLAEWSQSPHSDTAATRRAGQLRVRMVSGAATLASNQAVFAHSRVDYSATLNTDDALTRMLLRSVICPLEIRPEQVLLLHESGTAYGNAAEAGARDADAVQMPCRFHGRDTIFSSARFLRIPFPMNVASLRAEYEAHPRTPEAAQAQQPQSRSRTRLTLRDPERPMENLPAMSELTPPSLEVLVNEVEDAVSRHDVRAVGIVASDVRDKMFLAEEVRSRLRDVTFFTFEGNSLFLAPDKNAVFRGMLVLSSYPLSIENQWWTAGDPPRQLLPFANEGAEGIYNALLQQLGHDDAMTEYRAPFNVDALREPPVWLSMVGSRSFLPLAFDRDTSRTVVNRRPPEGLGFFTVLGLLLLAAGLAYAAVRTVQRNDPTPTVASDLERPVLEDHVRWGSQIVHRHLYAFLRILALLSVFIPSAVLAYTSVSGTTPPGPTIGIVTVALVSAVMAAFYIYAGGGPGDGGTVAVPLDGEARGAGGEAVRPRPVEPRLPLRASAGSVRRLLPVAIITGILASLFVARARSGAKQDTAEKGGEGEAGGQGGRGAGGPGSPAGSRSTAGMALVHVLAVSVAVCFTAGAAVLLSQTVSTLAYSMLIGVLLLAWVAGAGAAAWHALQATRATRAVWRASLAYAWSGRTGLEQALWLGEIIGRTGVLGIGIWYFWVAMEFSVSLFSRFGNASFPMLLERLGGVDSGASPLLLLALAGVGFAAWCTWHLQRIELLRSSTAFEAGVRGANGRSDLSPALKKFTERVAEVRNRLFLLMPSRSGALFLPMMVVLAALLYQRFQPTVERMIGLGGFDLLLRLAIVGSLCATVWAVYRLLAVWRALQRVLVSVGESPLLPAFRRLPASASQLTRLTLWASSACDVVESLSDAQWRQLVTIYNAGKLGEASKADEAGKEKPGLDPEMRDRVTRLMNAGGPVCRIDRPPDEKRDHRLLDLADVLWRMWRCEPDTDALLQLDQTLKDKQKTDTASIFRERFATTPRLWLRAAEEFAAVQVVDYVEWVLQQLRTLALFLFVTLIITTALISSYPFQPQGDVKLVFTLLLVGTVASILYVMVAMNRNEVLSHIADTDPGRLNWNWSFALNVGAVALVPMLTLLSSEIPGLHSVLFSWIQPVLNALTGGH
jgi:hypothetical protein